MTTPLVSVCIATFNHARYIRDCIMSVIAQAGDVTLEILVGDDLSEDGASAIVEALAREYPHLIRHFLRTRRLGPTENYFSLIRDARGRFIANLDGDDFWLPGKLAAQVSFLERRPDCPAVCSNALVIRDDGVPLGMFNNPQPERFDINALLRMGNFLNNSSILYWASLRENLLAMPVPSLDYRAHLCLARHGDIGYLNQVLVAYRVGSSSSMVANQNDLVRRLYWEALLDVPRGAVNPDDLAWAMAGFVRSVLLRAIRKKDVSMLFRWMPVIMAASPVGWIKMCSFICAGIVRTVIRKASDALCARLSGNHLRILFRR